jgi:hypothetical protein
MFFSHPLDIELICFKIHNDIHSNPLCEKCVISLSWAGPRLYLVPEEIYFGKYQEFMLKLISRV